MQNQNQRDRPQNNADGPPRKTRSGWGQIAKRTGQQIKADHLQIVAAGVAFYFFLALFPAIAAFVSIYGLLFDPAQSQEQIGRLSSFLPPQATEVITQFAQRVASESNGALGWGVAISLLLSLWSANKGAKGLFEGLNVAYSVEDQRGILKKTGLTLLFTLTAVVLGILAVVLVAVFPAVVGLLPLPQVALDTLNVLRWPLAALVAAVLIGYAYRVGPDRIRPKRRWIDHGSIIATFLWLAGSALFSLYVSNSNSFGATYGSFAAVVILMLWFFMTAFVMLTGAEINSEIERQRAPNRAEDGPP